MAPALDLGAVHGVDEHYAVFIVNCVTYTMWGDLGVY